MNNTMNKSEFSSKKEISISPKEADLSPAHVIDAEIEMVENDSGQLLIEDEALLEFEDNQMFN